MAPRASITWPMCALIGELGGFILAVLYVIPPDDAQSRSTLLGILVTASGAATAWFMRQKTNELREGVADVKDEVADVKEKVNGRMSQLITEASAARDALERALVELEAERAKNGGQE